MSEYKKLKYYFDRELGSLLADKICPLYPAFRRAAFLKEIDLAVHDQELKQRVETIADALVRHMPSGYVEATDILGQILGPENEKETGMFTEGYRLMPVAFFVEKYGVDHFDVSVRFIEEITKRNTGEWAIRPFLLKYPEKTLRTALDWSANSNAHVRRLASEGLRPRLPWARKIDIFSADPSPVIAVLERLKSDPSAYVRKSVANNMADFLKDNYDYTIVVLERWSEAAGKETQWIVRHALRNELKSGNPRAQKLIRS